ncbi:MAG: 4a-hydroxytetrahydrobiopterin dehydratase [Aureispira sp.]
MFTEKENYLVAELKFKDFVAAFAFMTEAAFHIEQQNHHPEWENVYNTITIRLTTHDAGNQVTDKDHQLAQTLTQLYQKHSH